MSVIPPQRVGPHLRFATEGQLVWAPFDKRRHAVSEVVCAAGDHARVRIRRDGRECWFRVEELFEYLPPRPS